MPIQAIIFDIDNTLLDWSARRVGWFSDPEGHNVHLTKVARRFDPHIAQSKLDELIQAFKQEQLQFIDDDLEEAPHLGKMIANCLMEVGLTSQLASPEEVLRAYDWITTPDVHPFPDVLEVLPQLQAKGYRFGIITNGYQPMWMRDQELDAYGLLKFFPECRFSSADVGVLKPEPDIFHMALECLGVPAQQAIYVGDNPVMDVLGAQNVKMKAVWRAPSGLDASTWSLRIKPDGVISTLHELLAILDQW